MGDKPNSLKCYVPAPPWGRQVTSTLVDLKRYQIRVGSFYYSVQTLLSSRLLSKNLKIKIYKG